MAHDPDESDEKRLLKRHVAQLAEHFDTVSLFVSRYRQDGSGDTDAWTYGNGNGFARVGQVREWLMCQEEKVKRDWAAANRGDELDD